MSRVPNKRAKSDGGESCLSYTPQNTMDYGTLLCTATNTVGEQRKPCVFHIIMAGKEKQKKNICLSNFPINLLFLQSEIVKVSSVFSCMAWLYILTDILKTEISSDKTKRLLKYTSIT